MKRVSASSTPRTGAKQRSTPRPSKKSPAASTGRPSDVSPSLPATGVGDSASSIAKEGAGHGAQRSQVGQGPELGGNGAVYCIEGEVRFGKHRRRGELRRDRTREPEARQTPAVGAVGGKEQGVRRCG